MNATVNHVFIKGTNELMQCIKCQTFDMLGFKKVDHKHPHCVGCYKQVQKEKRTLSKCDCCGKKHGVDECKGIHCGACNDHDYHPLTFLAGVMRCSFCVDDYNNYTCEICGEYEYEEVGLSTGENGVEKRVCSRCDIDCCDYNGWGDKPEEEEEDCRTKPCSCGCGYLGGSCDKGLAIDNNECTNCRDSTCDEAYKFSRGAEVMVLCDGCGGDWYNGIWERDGWKRV